MRRKAVAASFATILALTTSSAWSTDMSISDRAWWSGQWAPTIRYGEPTMTARYVTVRDGTRIATYRHLPKDLQEGDRLPTILVVTPYASVVELTWLGKLAQGTQSSFAEEHLVRHGFAVVKMDIRGSGASFGTRPSVFMPDVLRDCSDVLDWIVEQPWSNGKVGLTGVSGLGMNALWVAAIHHPAVKAIAPRFTVFDIFDDTHPGGLAVNGHARDVTGRQMRLLDANRIWKQPRNPFARLLRWNTIEGIRPMDDDPEGVLLEEAVREHGENGYFGYDIFTVRYRDERLPGGSDATLDTQSPHRHVDALKASRIPIYAMGGWMDGALQRALIHLHKAVYNPGSKLVIGPWGHTERWYSSPFVAGERGTDFDWAGELTRFFDHHLRGVDTGIDDEPPIHYFTLGSEEWRSADEWPPHARRTRLHFDSGNRLSFERPADVSTFDEHAVDLDHTTGRQSRFGRSTDYPIDYPDREERDEGLLTYTSEPLSEPVEITGHPIVTLHLSSDSTEGAVFVYLEDVAPDGSVRNVTDGILVAEHRSTTDAEPPYWRAGPYRTFRKADAAPIVPGKIMKLEIELLPISYELRAGHSIRVALAGADAENFPVFPKGRSPVWKVYRGGAEHASFVDIPIARGDPR